jgi:hypothetical protein
MGRFMSELAHTLAEGRMIRFVGHVTKRPFGLINPRGST